MKKIVLIFACILMALISGIKAMATVPTYEFLPVSGNCLDPSNLIFLPGASSNTGKIKTITPFRIKSNATFYLCLDEYHEGRYNNVKITEYKSDKTVIGQATTSLFSVYEFIEFKTNVNTYFINIEADVEFSYGEDFGMSDVAKMYKLVEGPLAWSTLTDNLQNSKYPYNGPDTSGLQLISGTYVVNTTLSNQIALDSITDKIKVYDMTDGNMTDKLVIKTNNYSTNIGKVGPFSVVYEARNSVGVIGSVTVMINVSDDIKPIISGNNEFIMYSTNLKTVTDIKNSLSATDNIDGNITNKIQIANDDFTNRNEILGNYDVTFSVSDEAFNQTTFTVTVKVLQGDTTAPVFGGINIFELTVTTPKTIAEILAQVTAVDDWDGDVKNKIVVVRNEYEYNKTKRGTYYIDLSVKDNAGNISTHQLIINVKDLSLPVFFITSVVLFMPVSEAMLSTEEIIRSLYKTNYIACIEDVAILYNDYEENKKTPGEYYIVLESDEMEFSVCVTVLNVKDYNIASSEEPKSKENLFESVGSFFDNLYRRIKSFFGRLF